MKYFLTFIIGLLVGVGAHWYAVQPKGSDMVVNARESVRETTEDVGQTFKDTFDSENLKEELAQTGKVIREKTRQAGDAISDATANARITASIKAKLIKESNLAALKIDVDTRDSVVTLSGTVSSHDEIVQAMRLAWETEGVYKVVSTLQVNPS